MGTIVASKLTDRASLLLQDTTHIRWTEAELLGWLNDGLRELSIFKPNAFLRNQAVALVAGSKQSMPADSNGLQDITRNLGTDGATPGPVIHACSKSLLDWHVPNWHTAAPSSVVKNFMYNASDIRHFYVYPPQPATGTGQVEMIYAFQPADIAITDTIPTEDVYGTALVNYVLFRAYSKDTEYAANPQIASAYYQAFTNLIGAKTGSEGATDPNVHDKGVA